MNGSALNRLAFGLVPLLALTSVAIAHGPTIEVTGLKVVHVSAGEFLEMQVDPPAVGARLIALSTPFGSGELEGRVDSDYQVVESVPITHEQSAFGVSSPYRVRLPDIPPRTKSVPVTLLFSGGTIVQSQAAVEGRSNGYRAWLVVAGAAIAALLATITAKVVNVNRRELRGISR